MMKMNDKVYTIKIPKIQTFKKVLANEGFTIPDVIPEEVWNENVKLLQNIKNKYSDNEYKVVFENERMIIDTRFVIEDYAFNELFDLKNDLYDWIHSFQIYDQTKQIYPFFDLVDFSDDTNELISNFRFLSEYNDRMNNKNELVKYRIKDLFAFYRRIRNLCREIKSRKKLKKDYKKIKKQIEQLRMEYK